MMWIQLGTLLLVCIDLFHGSIAYRAEIRKLHADVETLKKNNNSFRDAMQGVVEWMKLHDGDDK